MGMDLSYLEAFMGGAAEEPGSGAGGVYVLGLGASPDDVTLRLVGKARVVADALGAYVYLLCDGDEAAAQRAIRAGADTVLLATGVPTLAELADFLGPKQPQVILFPRTALGRALGPGLAEKLGGALCGYAADLAVDPVYQRVVAHQPVLDDAARQTIALLRSPAVIIVDTGALPAPYNEPWRQGHVEPDSVNWTTVPRRSVNWTAATRRSVNWTDHPAAGGTSAPVALANASIIVAVGRGLKERAAFDVAEALAAKLGAAVGGDLGALDAGWIGEEQLIGLTGKCVAPKVLLALGVDGDTSFFMATQEAGAVIAVQRDPVAPIVPVADQNIIADPAAFAAALTAELAK